MSAASHISSQSSVIRQSSETRSCTAFTRFAFCCFKESIITERHFSRFVSSTGEVSAEDGKGKGKDTKMSVEKTTGTCSAKEEKAVLNYQFKSSHNNILFI